MRICHVFLLSIFSVLALPIPDEGGWVAHAEDSQILPQTKLRVTIVQWVPAKGEYQQWNALGGEFVVSQAGTVQLPVIGSVEVGMMDAAALAADIATRIQNKIGLVSKPDITVEILGYPPIYVVGDVNKPGEYPFRSGLTALQAVALGGGQLRIVDPERSQNETRLVGELQLIDNENLRSTARMARLQAEMSGAKEIQFPDIPASGVDSKTLAQIFAQEKIVFAARANELDRQTKSLSELRELLTAEIDVLQEKIKASDASVKSAESELTAVSGLVDKGFAVASRKSDLERALAGYRVDRLDQITAVMRARQSVTEATRNLDGLRDKRQTDIASDLQREQANLEQLAFRRNTAQKLLLEQLASNPDSSGSDEAVTFAITRLGNGGMKEITAAETTALLPGDVVKVKLRHESPLQSASPSAPASSSAGAADSAGFSQ